MKHDFPGRTGFGFALVLAGLTLVIAVLSGIYLVYQSDMGLQAGIPLELPAISSPGQVPEAKPPHTDHLRAKPQRIARNQRLRRGKSA
jgi:hypothetical protein